MMNDTGITFASLAELLLETPVGWFVLVTICGGVIVSVAAIRTWLMTLRFMRDHRRFMADHGSRTRDSEGG